MAANIIPFVYNDKPVRSMMRGDEPWFVGKDVCAVLDIKNHNDALARLDEDERRGSAIPTPFGQQEVVIVSEPGVFRLVFTSRRPEAEAFKRWLAHDVLPQLRRTGRYAVQPDADSADLAAEPFRAAEIKLAMVREARLLFGTARAGKLWGDLKLPVIPEAPDTPDSSARGCFHHLLAEPVSGDDQRALAQVIELAADEHLEQVAILKQLGLRVDQDGEQMFVWVANHSTFLDRCFDQTEWSGGRHRHALARLPGARSGVVRNIGGRTARGVLVPAKFLDTALLM